MNAICLMGRLTGDPELKTTQSGVSVTSFSVAVDRAYRSKDQERQTDFINCVAWNKTAEFVSNYFSKGKMIIVIGRISTRSWEGQDGKKNYVTEVVASEVSFGESKRAQDGGASAPRAAGGEYSAPVAAPQMPQDLAEDDFSPLLETDDDLPF